MGSASFIPAMVFEFYWHHAVQHWDYENTFHWANGAMYFFMSLAFALAAAGFAHPRLEGPGAPGTRPTKPESRLLTQKREEGMA